MNILGYEVSDAQENACLRAMSSVFKMEDVRGAAVIAEVPESWVAEGASRVEDLPSLVAARLIGRQLNSGAIIKDGTIYRATGPVDDV